VKDSVTKKKEGRVWSLRKKPRSHIDQKENLGGDKSHRGEGWLNAYAVYGEGIC